MPVKESRHQVRDVSVRMLQSGSGPLVLFLHGANGLPQWLPFFERLATQFDVRVPEHPGYGTSDNPAWMRNVGDLAMYYLDFLDGLDGGKVHLIGHSLGGWAAAEMATRNCARLASLTLLAPAGIRVKTLPCGDNFIWGPDEVVKASVVSFDVPMERPAGFWRHSPLKFCALRVLMTEPICFLPRRGRERGSVRVLAVLPRRRDKARGQSGPTRAQSGPPGCALLCRNTPRNKLS